MALRSATLPGTRRGQKSRSSDAVLVGVPRNTAEIRVGKAISGRGVIAHVAQQFSGM
jgi:hypothetical protein